MSYFYLLSCWIFDKEFEFEYFCQASPFFNDITKEIISAIRVVIPWDAAVENQKLTGVPHMLY